MSQEEIVEQLLTDYKENPSVENRNKIILFCDKKIETLVLFYCKKRQLSDLNNDLRQEAFLAVIDAINHYKYNGKFLTCVGYWIKKRFYNYYNEMGRQVPIPKSLRITINKIKEFSTHFEKENGRSPKKEEIGKELNIRYYRLSDMEYFMKPMALIEEVEVGTPDHLTNLTENELHIDLMECIKKLNSKEQFILKEYYGFNSYPKTFKEISKKTNMTFQRVHQVTKVAKEKVKKYLLKRI